MPDAPKSPNVAKAGLICAGILMAVVVLANDGGDIERAIGSSKSGPTIWQALDKAINVLPKHIRGDVREFLRNNALPKAPPDVPGYDVAGASIPAETVGGDYFDYIALGDDRLGRLRGGMVVHRHRPARARQIERDGAADAPSGPGDQGGARIVVGMRRFRCGVHARQSAQGGGGRTRARVLLRRFR